MMIIILYKRCFVIILGVLLLGNDLIEKLKPYEPEQYSFGITNAKLISVALLKLEDEKIEKTFENVVVAVSKLFPGKFSLIHYPHIPDTMRIDNTLRLDAGKNHAEFIMGNRVKGYRLTGLGKIAAEETIEQLEVGSNSSDKKRIGKSRKKETRLVSDIMDSIAYDKFSKKQFSSINKFDVCDVLHGTLETNSDKLANNLDTLKYHTDALKPIKEYEKLANDVSEFLNYLKEHWESWIK